MGKLAKTIAVPYKADRACLLAMRGTIREGYLPGWTGLEQAAQKRPSYRPCGNRAKKRRRSPRRRLRSKMPSVRPRAMLARGFLLPVHARGPPVLREP